ncbi:DNA repair exonuclease, partial [groundwater metagenome]
MIPQIADEIKKITAERGEKYTILMMHFGMEGQIKQDVSGEIPYNSLLPLKDMVNYLAIGHYHSQYEYDGWVFNPGSVEMITMNEYDLPKGFYHVREKGAKLITPITRPIRRIKLDLSGIPTPEELYSNVQSTLDREKTIQSDKTPLIELLLYGELNFPKSDINLERIKEMIEEHFNPLWSEVRLLKTNSPYAIKEGDVRGLTREQIELRVFSDRIKLDWRYRNNVEELVK